MLHIDDLKTMSLPQLRKLVQTKQKETKKQQREESKRRKALLTQRAALAKRIEKIDIKLGDLPQPTTAHTGIVEKIKEILEKNPKGVAAKEIAAQLCPDHKTSMWTAISYLKKQKLVKAKERGVYITA